MGIGAAFQIIEIIALALLVIPLIFLQASPP